MFMYLRIFLNMYFCMFLNTHSFSLEICVFYVTLCISPQHTRLFSILPPGQSVAPQQRPSWVAPILLNSISFLLSVSLLLCAPVNVENFNIFLPQEKLRHTKAQPERHLPLTSPLLSPTWRPYLTSDPVTWHETIMTLHSRSY